MIGQLLPFLAAEHQQQVAQAVERAKQVTMPELNAIIGVSNQQLQLVQNYMINTQHTHTQSGTTKSFQKPIFLMLWFFLLFP